MNLSNQTVGLLLFYGVGALILIAFMLMFLVAKKGK
jgi:hypothetical protein